MKSLKYFAALCLMSTTALFVGCTKSDETTVETEDKVTFPTATDIVADIDGEYTIKFDAAVNWSATTNVSWIMFVEGSDLYSSTSGKAGDDVELVFQVNDSEFGFGDDSGTITLSMGGESAVVANISREGKEATIVFYSLNMETYEEYEIDPNEPFELPWSNNAGNFSRKLHFEANFDWVIEGLPDWISNPTTYPVPTAGNAGDPFSHMLVTDYSGYTNEEQMEATIKIVSESDPEINYSLTLTTRGAKALMVLTASDSYQGYNFDADGTYGSQLDGTTNSKYDFTYITEGEPELAPPFAISCSADGNGGYSFDSNSDWASSWVYIEEAYDDVYDQEQSIVSEIIEDVRLGDYLTMATRSIAVGVNSGAEARSAAIFALPESLYNDYSNVTDFYDASGSVKAELEQYIIGYVEQKGAAGVALEFMWDNPSRTATITKMDPSHELYDFYLYEFSVPADAIFILEYQNTGAEQINYPFTFNWDTDNIIWRTITTPLSGEEEWLSLEPAETYFQVTMGASQYSEGYVILQQNSLNAVAIHCIQNVQ
ncbi:MAG: hypothetical protein R3Y08_04170 [Rikenellaceae bacterium]